MKTTTMDDGGSYIGWVMAGIVTIIGTLAAAITTLWSVRSEERKGNRDPGKRGARMQDGPSVIADQNWEDGRTDIILGTSSAQGLMSLRQLQFIILVVLATTVLLNIALAWLISEKLSVQPRDVLRAIDERLEVTPKQVMERLDRIEKEHMNYVNEYRKLHDK